MPANPQGVGPAAPLRPADPVPRPLAGLLTEVTGLRTVGDVGVTVSLISDVPFGIS